MKIIDKIIKKTLLLLYALINQINFHFKFRTIDIILNKLRIGLLRMCGAKIGNNSSIHPKVMILMPQNLIVEIIQILVQIVKYLITLNSQLETMLI